MTKNEYLKTLAGNLNGHLTKEEIGDILRDYQEFFEDGAIQNEEEAQIAERLGDPKEVAVQIVAESYIDQAQAVPTVRNLFKARAAVKAFSAMAFVLSIPLIMGVTALTVVLAAAFLALVAASLVIFSGLLMFLGSLPPSAAGLAAAVALIMSKAMKIFSHVFLRRRTPAGGDDGPRLCPLDDRPVRQGHCPPQQNGGTGTPARPIEPNPGRR